MRSLILLIALTTTLPACYDPADQSRGFTPALPGQHANYIDNKGEYVPPDRIPTVPLSEPVR